MAKERLSGGTPDSLAFLSLEDAAHLLEELQIHQVELELQNEHLSATRSQLEVALNQSAELYDFSPVGSVSLDAQGTICKLNLAAAGLLWGERSRLVGVRFALYVGHSELAAFNAMLANAKKNGQVQNGEIALTHEQLPERYVQIQVSSLPQDAGWQLVLVDATERRQMIQCLRQSEERWSLALEAAGDGVWDWNTQTDAALFSRGFEELFGFSEGDYGSHIEAWYSRIHPDDRPGVLADVQANLTGKTLRLMNEHRCQCKDGHWLWVLNRAAIVSRTPDGLPLRMIGTVTDITTIKKTEEALQLAVRFQQAVFDSLAAHTMVLDRHGKIIQANVAWQQYVLGSGCAQGDAPIGAQYLDMLACLTRGSQNTLSAVAEGIALVASGRASGFQLKLPFSVPEKQHWFSMKVTAVGDADGRVVVSHEDVTVLKVAELTSLALANTDVLTGALSRRNFLNLAETELARAIRYQIPLMLLMLDLDHFKSINDQYGHAAGDRVLQEFVKTVTGVLRESDLTGRLGGEEFAVLLPNTSPDGGNALAQRIIDSVRNQSVAYEAQLISYSVSIGACQLSSEVTFAELLSRADVALYRAKEGGRDRLEFAGP